MIRMLFILLILFLAVIGSIFYYIMRWHMKKASLTAAEQQRISTLQAQADKLEQRVKILEAILDSKVPDWRKL
jgi:phage shock protein B